MSDNKMLSAISLNLLYAMEDQSFFSHLMGCKIEIKNGKLTLDTGNQVELSNEIIESLYPEFIWHLENKVPK